LLNYRQEIVGILLIGAPCRAKPREKVVRLWPCLLNRFRR